MTYLLEKFQSRFECMTYLLEKFQSRFDSLSNDFFIEARKLLIEYYPVKKPGISYINYVTIDASDN